MAERLYHFTAARFVPAILRDGLTLGAVLITDRPPYRIDRAYRWLTTSPDWEQSWAEGTGRLPYRRNEVRLAIDVPAHMTGRLLRWTVTGPLLSDAYDTLSAYGDPENWRLYRGDVPAEWIVGTEFNPAYVAPVVLSAKG